ncbi:MAG: hypothetical protein ACYSU7_12715 [Planctomycetota bacterium]|jgi:hypothetical protein
MARKHIGPALYELMRGRRAEPRAAEPPPETESADWGWLSPGRTVRLPIGYLLLAAAVVLTAVVASFTVGYSRGEGQAKAQLDQEWLATNQQTLAVPPPETRPAPAPARTEPSPRETPAPEAAPAESGWGQVLSDPREPGKNYFVLIHTRRDGAVMLAEFSRAHGVEAYAVRAKNLSLYKVIALPGFGGGERSTEFVTDLERRIEEVFRSWKLQVNPRDDLAHYPEKFEG